MEKSDNKHQHWVPQFYLRYFATPDTIFGNKPQIAMIDKELSNRTGKITSVRNVCGKRYLYTLLNDDGTRDKSLDDWLTKLESIAAPIWKNLHRDITIIGNQDVRSCLALFIAAMHLRNFAMFNLVHSTITLRNKLYRTPTREEMATKDSSCYDLLNTGKAYRKFFLDGIEKSTSAFMSKNWAVLTCTRDAFITSDRPVSIFDGNNSKAGPHTRNAVTMFPINPRATLVIGDKVEFGNNGPIEANDKMVRSTNKHMHIACSKILITGRTPMDVISEIESA